MHSSVIPFNKKPEPFHKFLDYVRKEYDEGRLKDGVFVFRADNKVHKDEYAGLIDWFWWGDNSSIYCLGLCQYMLNVIQNYIDENG